jgi:diacylglycerol kinase (ATP)
LVKQARKSPKRTDPWKKVQAFFSGLILAIQSDRSVAVQLVISGISLAVCFWFREWVDFLLILIVTGMMIASEIFNTTIEAICDYLQPEHDPRIGKIKDMAAAGTGICVIIWTVTLVYEFFRVLSSIG